MRPRAQSRPGLCAPASLRYALLAIGRRVPEADLVRACRATQANGASEWQIAHGASLHGLTPTVHAIGTADVARLTLRRSLRRGHPCVLCVSWTERGKRLDSEHWVTAVAIGSRRYVVVDPSRDAERVRALTWPELRRWWRATSIAGECFSMVSLAPTGKRNGRTARRIAAIVGVHALPAPKAKAPRRIRPRGPRPAA